MKKEYIYVGSATALEFPDLRVECSSSGTPFSYALDPAREALMIAGGAIIVSDRRVTPAKDSDAADAAKPDQGRSK